MSYIDKMQVGEETYEIKDSSAARASDIATLETAIAGKQDNLNQAQLTAVNSGIDSTKVGQIATNTNDIDAIEGKIPAQATSSNQLADKDFVNSSVATNTAYYISDNGEPFDSLADLEAYSGTLTNNDYAFVVGTDAAGNTTYTRYKYNADTETWAEEYVLNNSSFTAEQWAAINSGITSGDVTKLSGLANIKTIGSNLSLDSNGELSATDTTYTAGTNVSISSGNVISATDTTYTNFTGTDGTSAGTAGLVPAPATTDAGKVLSSNGSWTTPDAGIKTLTTADYNYPTTGTKISIAAWLLDSGVYEAGEDIKLRYSSSIAAMDTLGKGSLFIVSNRAADTSNGYYLGQNQNGRLIYRFYSKLGGIVTNAAMSDEGVLRGGDAVNNLTSTDVFVPLSANQGKVLNDKIEGRILNGGTTAPTTSTKGSVGTQYTCVNNGTPEIYICTDTTGGTYTWTKIN